MAEEYKGNHVIGYDRHVRDPQTRRTVRIEGVLATVELEISLDELASLLGAKAAMGKRKVSKMLGGIITAKVVDECVVHQGGPPR